MMIVSTLAAVIADFLLPFFVNGKTRVLRLGSEETSANVVIIQKR